MRVIDLSFERYVAGGMLRQMMTEVGPHHPKAGFPDKAPPDDVMQRARQAGFEAGLAALSEQLRAEPQFATKLADSRFALRQPKSDATGR